MSTDLFKTVNYNDGEGLTYGDANDAQRFLASRLNDQVIGKLLGNPNNNDPEFVSQQGVDASTSWAYALSVGGANPRQGSSNNKVKIGAGTLLQKVGTDSGDEPSLLAYTFDGTLEFTLANGDATNPRVDMIQMQLSYVTDDLQSRDFEDGTTHVVSTQSMNKKRQVQATVNVKSGTPAASPAYPSPDSGFVPIACVVVGATYSGATGLKYVDTAGAVAVLHDLRMPICTKPYLVEEKNPNSLSLTIPLLSSMDNVNGNPVNIHTRNSGRWQLAANSAALYYPIALNVGDVISAYVVGIHKQDTSAAVSSQLIKSTEAGETTLSAGTASTLVAGVQILPEIGLTTTVTTGFNYFVKITPGGGITPAADLVDSVTVNFKRLGANGRIVVPCPTTFGRLIAVAATTTTGSHTANTARLFADIAGASNAYIADISAVTETGSTPTRHKLNQSTLEAAALFTGGPTVTGNGTHAPPIWCNGKRAYEEAINLGSGSTTPYRLSAGFEYPTPGIDVYDVTYYVAEGL